MARNLLTKAAMAVAAIAAISAGGSVLAQAPQPSAPPAAGQGGMGPGMMGGQGMMGGRGGGMGPSMMMGRGMMMNGYGPGRMMGGGYQARPQGDLKLSARDVTANMDHWLAMMGNPHLKLGPVVEKDADTITADVVTVDKGGLVQRLEINRHDGATRPAAG